MKDKILETYNQLKLIDDNLDQDILMFSSIYLHYNFKNNGCPYYNINQTKLFLSEDIQDKLPDFQPKYNLFLQDMYDLILLWVFDYKINTRQIKKIQLNIKINLNVIQFEIYNNRTIQDLINLISEYYKMRPNNIVIKKNNIQLDRTKYILEYNLDFTSQLVLYINLFS